MATQPVTFLDLARQREALLLENLVALAREGAPLPGAREMSRMLGLKGGGGGYKVLGRLARSKLVAIEGNGPARVVHLLDAQLSIAAVPRRPIADILETVARAACMSCDEVTGPRRTKLYLRPRFVAVMLAREERWSFSQIGKALGGRDHSTIISAFRRGQEMLATDKLFQRLYARSRNALTGLRPLPETLFANRAVSEPVADEDEPERCDAIDLYRRRRAASAFLAALRREHPERFAA